MLKQKQCIEDLKVQMMRMDELNEALSRRLSLCEQSIKLMTERLEELSKAHKEEPRQDQRKPNVTPEQVINEYFYFKEERLSNGAE